MSNVVQIISSHFEYLLRQAKPYQSEVLFAVCVLILSYLITSAVRDAFTKLPPGPFGLPIVGYLPFLKKDTYLQFIELGKKYGEVFRLRFGSKNVVVLNGVESIREALAKPEFLGRPPDSLFSALGRESPFFTSGFHVWKEQRRFVVHSMKDLGLGRTKIEDEIQDEIKNFMDVLKSYNGTPMILEPSLASSVSNNITALVFGERYKYEDLERKELDRNQIEVNRGISQTTLLAFIPWLRYVPFVQKKMSIDKAVHAFKRTEKIFHQKIKEHLETLDPKNIRDFIDSYLVETETRTGRDINTSLTYETLIGSATDLFGAGSGTVRAAIRWCVYVMASFLDVQKKIQNEIEDVLGPDRSPEHQDLQQMPYTRAVIMEIMRWKSIVPVNVFRYTLADTTVTGYTIPKDTIVVANFWAVHHDPKLWKEPESFKPERFLATDGRAIERSPNFMPFSIGKRACPGETMANMEIFLYLSSILQKFDIRFPDDYKPTFESEFSITYRPKTYLVRFISKS